MTALPATRASVNGGNSAIGPFSGGVKASVDGKEEAPVMVSQLEPLIAQLGTMGCVIVMIADKLHILSCLRQERVIGNEDPLVERTGIPLAKIRLTSKNKNLRQLYLGQLRNR